MKRTITEITCAWMKLKPFSHNVPSNQMSKMTFPPYESQLRDNLSTKANRISIEKNINKSQIRILIAE